MTVTRDASGQQFLLRATDIGSLDVAARVLPAHQEDRQVAYELDGDGRGVTLHIFVNAPYDN